MRYDCVVIGGGVSGITSALTMARHGRSVALLEKAPQTAPLLRGFARRGVRFDTGFHYSGALAPGEPLELFLRYLGVADRVETFPFDADGFDLFVCEDPSFELRIPTGYDNVRDRLCAGFPDERAAIDVYLSEVRAVCAAMPYLNLEAEMTRDAALQRVMGATLRETLDRLTGNELLKSVLSMHSLLYGVSCREVSFAQHAAIVGSYYQSVRGIRGGGFSLARAFDAALAEAGVEVLCGGEASAIELSPGGEVSGVRLSGGERLACGRVIATLHPHLLLDLVPRDAFRPAYRKRLGALQETVSAFLCFATCDAPIPSLAGRNRFIIPDQHALGELGRRPVGKGPLYLSGAYRDGALEPEGFIGICPALFKDASSRDSRPGRRPDGYRDYKEQALARVSEQLRRSWPELSERVVTMEASTPLTIRDYCATPLGGLYGVKHMVGQYNPHPVTRVPGLFLAGQAIVAPGVLGAVLSGLLACGAVLGHELLRKELKGCC